MRPVDLILDSGAFSAWKKQETLDVYKYIEYCHTHRESLHEVVNLDVIPASWGVDPTLEQVESSAGKSWENLMIMRKAGIEAMPVYHMGERRYWLEKMIGEGFKYVGISPANDRTTAEKIAWLDEIFGFLSGAEGFPEVKTHGFGVTALPILFRYPWYSADSITWMIVAAYGGILLPMPDAEQMPRYDISPLGVHMSTRGAKVFGKHDEALAQLAGSRSGGGNDAHYYALGESTRAYVDAYIEAEGFNAQLLIDDSRARAHFNCRFFKRVVENLKLKPFKQPSAGFFSGVVDPRPGRSTPIDEHIHHVYTMSTDPEVSDMLLAEECRDRLISYYAFKDRPPFNITRYCELGTIAPEDRIPKRPRKKAKVNAAQS